MGELKLLDLEAIDTHVIADLSGDDRAIGEDWCVGVDCAHNEEFLLREHEVVIPEIFNIVKK